MSINEIVPKLWIGDLKSARNSQELKKRGIFSILSAIRGRFRIHETFIRHQIQLDDTQDADIMTHLLPSINFIQAELDKGRGVLVHCHAGISRSPAIVVGYLMYSRGIDCQTALNIVRQARPIVDPNENFLRQLEIFHNAQCKIQRQNKDIRQYYLRRTVQEVMNGDGSTLETTMFSSFPNSLSNPASRSPGIAPCKRIRCRMCRQELATREHMLDHGRPSSSIQASRRLTDETNNLTSTLLTSTLLSTTPDGGSPPPPRSDQYSSENAKEKVETDASRILGYHPARAGTSQSSLPLQEDGHFVPEAHGVEEYTSLELKPVELPTTHLKSPSEPATQDPKLSAFQSPAALTSGQARPILSGKIDSIINSLSILVDPKCSGYFVEPMKWMDHFLSTGQLAGKITCPNKKCGVKLGNYDWAGVCCGCKEWVTPGFCINRSKVDEVV